MITTVELKKIAKNNNILIRPFWDKQTIVNELHSHGLMLDFQLSMNDPTISNMYTIFMVYFVYLLICSDGSTYVGATTNLNQRLRKHNKIIKGGANSTGIKVDQGETWTRKCYVSGFPGWTEALKFEWRWKQLSRKLPRRMQPQYSLFVFHHKLI